MSGLSINNLNNGNSSHYAAGYANSKEANADNNGSPVSNKESVNGSTPSGSFDVLEPLEFENPFELPYDWESNSLPFEAPETMGSSLPVEMPVEVAPAIPPTDGVVTEVMEPYTHGDGGASKAAANGKKVSNEELGEKYKCSTCESRKYQDVSNDPGVSFQAPTKISKEAANSAVAAHEQQHVRRNAQKAEREDKEVVRSTVVYHSDICEECGDVYRSGGTTTTVTRDKPETPQETEKAKEERKKLREQLSFSFEI